MGLAWSALAVLPSLNPFFIRTSAVEQLHRSPDLVLGVEVDRLTLTVLGATTLAIGFARTENLSTQGASYIADAARGFGQNDDITVLTIVCVA